MPALLDAALDATLDATAADTAAATTADNVSALMASARAATVGDLPLGTSAAGTGVVSAVLGWLVLPFSVWLTVTPPVPLTVAPPV